MSTVLWANYLADGVVTSDESDKYALYKYTDKLDTICRRCGTILFSEVQDTTDIRFNMSDAELPSGMSSTDEVMAVSGVWANANDALQMLEAILREIQAENIRFGLIRNVHDTVIEELTESILFARKAAAMSARFNYSVVM